jgi:hypothetical protein
VKGDNLTSATPYHIGEQSNIGYWELLIFRYRQFRTGLILQESNRRLQGQTGTTRPYILANLRLTAPKDSQLPLLLSRKK